MNENTILQRNSPSYKDARGEIDMIEENFQFGSVSRITTNAGHIRANHTHATDYHLCILMKGFMNYYERPMYSQAKPIKIMLKPGDKFFTRPCQEHAMESVTDTEFWCFSKHGREQSDYETDTFRFKHNLVEEYNKLV